MYDTLLVPTDGSEAAMDAAKHAYSLGERYDAAVHVLAVVEQSESASIVGQGDEKLETLQEDGTEATQKIIEEGLSRDIEAIGAVKVGDPDRVILDYAAEHNVDMIIMSTHGRSGVGRFLMGSITEQVIRGGEIPVLAIQR
ncbi:universal stress protein [Natrialba aegyptia]|uniref:UspA domain-containing protein n=1 Tax=Natrialba aegyptia DSM 13077 TaxID=1227491 RepID=M0AQD4_9EURY|nr:universal stress protein [Natrialba aegyptia]ELY99583.1 UspA domain-containing protein [Natrialba aegyptia DSM 13077]